MSFEQLVVACNPFPFVVLGLLLSVVTKNKINKLELNGSYW